MFKLKNCSDCGIKVHEDLELLHDRRSVQDGERAEHHSTSSDIPRNPDVYHPSGSQDYTKKKKKQFRKLKKSDPCNDWNENLRIGSLVPGDEIQDDLDANQFSVRTVRIASDSDVEMDAPPEQCMHHKQVLMESSDGDPD